MGVRAGRRLEARSRDRITTRAIELGAMVGEKDPHEYSATLGVYSETMSLADLTAALGEPTTGYDRGDQIGRVHKDLKRKHAGWFLESDGARVRKLEDMLADLALFMEEQAAAFETLGSRVERDIWCGIFSGEDAQGGFNFSPDLTRRLADLNVWVIFDLY
jgi:hypothetical protein